MFCTFFQVTFQDESINYILTLHCIQTVHCILTGFDEYHRVTTVVKVKLHRQNLR